VTDSMQGPVDEAEPAQRLVDQAKAEGVSLTGPGGLLGGLTKRVLDTALEGELDGHRGYAKHDPAGRSNANSRNGKAFQDGGDRGGPGRHRRGPRGPGIDEISHDAMCAALGYADLTAMSRKRTPGS